MRRVLEHAQNIAHHRGHASANVKEQSPWPECPIEVVELRSAIATLGE
jgi:hypothetical protein